MRLKDINWSLVLPLLVIAIGFLIAAFIVYFLGGTFGGIIAGGAGVTAIIFGVSIYLLGNPVVIDRWLSGLYKAGRKLDTSLDRGYVRKDIEAVVNSYDASDLGYELQHGIQLDWKREVDRSTIIDDGEVIVCLEDGDHQVQNLAIATYEYVENGVIPHSKRRIDICISLDILRNSGKKEAIRQLYEEQILPTLEEGTESIDENPIKRSYDQVEETRRGGLLGPVLLTEFEKLTEHGMPNDSIRAETEEFVDFLETISASERGEEVDLTFDGAYIEVSIGLMAQSAVRDLGPYEKMAKMNLAESETSYILAVGKNIDAAKEVALKTKELPGVDSFFEIDYKLDQNSNFGGEKDSYSARFERKEGVGN